MEMSSSNQCSSNEKEMIKDEFRFRTRVIKYFREYCENTSIHGFRYLAERRTACERIWWLISITISLSICISLVMQTYQKWQTAPVIVTFATQETPAWQTPFPAVTICPETKSLPAKFNFTEYVIRKIANGTLTDDENKKLGYLSLVCNYDTNFNDSLGPPFADTEDFYNFLENVSPDFDSMLDYCSFMGKSVSCKEIFFPVITDEGLCYTFNLLDRSQLFRDNVVFHKNFHQAPQLSNWSIEKGYDIYDEIDTYPKRALFSGSPFALEGILTAYEDDMDYWCRDGVQGWKMQISHPSRMPRVQQQHILIPLNRAIDAAVAPDIVATSEAVKKYDAHIRNCYFPSERVLQYFNVYSQENCQIECRTNFSKKMCGCVDFYMPKDNSSSICGQGKLACLFKAQETLLYQTVQRKLNILRDKENSEKLVRDECDCLPICTSMTYYVETSQSQWSWQKLFHVNRSRREHKSYFQVYFKLGQFMSSERNELFGITDFLANFGGLLGLFTGFSLLSLIEIVYYLTLRIVKNIKLFRSWSGE